tara:strand:+ start:345 stop:1319 length:975 start_codon:yes stop_codon:yes gene_type:complete
MKKILIFKTDRLGDLLNISPIISNLKLNNPSCEITLVCSSYNEPLVKYYNHDLNYVVYKKSIIAFLIENFYFIFSNKYDLILQLDGKNHSYLLSVLIRSTKKACINFIKYKKFFGLNLKIHRPNFLIKFFFDFIEISYENYNHNDNKKFHYLGLYLSLLAKLNIKIETRKHYLPFTPTSKNIFLNKKYLLFHLDRRWDIFPLNVRDNLKKKIISLSNHNKIIITSNIGSNYFYNFIKKELKNSKNIEFYDEPSLNNIISLVYFSETCVSSHSGLIVHSAAAFNKKIIDIVNQEIFNELDRWVPFEVNYKRYNVKNFLNESFIFA